jgi:hypothetical protein
VILDQKGGGSFGVVFGNGISELEVKNSLGITPATILYPVFAHGKKQTFSNFKHTFGNNSQTSKHK